MNLVGNLDNLFAKILVLCGYLQNTNNRNRLFVNYKITKWNYFGKYMNHVSYQS